MGASYDESLPAFALRDLAFNVTPISAAFLLDTGIVNVQVLLQTGVLTTDQANGLIDKLTSAISSLKLGNTQATCGQMNAFIQQVNAFMNSGKLTPAQGQVLIQIAEAVRTQISCA